MVRDTSRLAYEHIQQNGSLARRQWEVYSWLFHNGPATSSEVHAALRTPHEQRDHHQPCCTILTQRGFLRELPPRACKITGRKVLVYDVTSKMPSPTKKKIRHTQKPHSTGWSLALQDLLALINIGKKQGFVAWSPGFHELVDWLAHTLSCPTCRNKVVR